jgi:competence protein ComEC
MTSRSLGHRAPLLWLVLPLMAGLAAAKAGDFLPVPWLLAGAALASALGIIAGWRGWIKSWAAALVVAMLLAGAASYALYRPRLTAWDALPPREARLGLRIDRIFSQADARKSSGVATVVRADAPVQELHDQRLYFSLALRKGELPPLRGAVIKAVGVLATLPRDPPANTFDGYLASAGTNFRLTRGRVLAVERPAPAYSRFCARALARFSALLGLGVESKRPGLVGVLRAMLLGQQHELGDEQKTLFRQSGTMHVFSISGLHIAVISAGLQALLSLLRLPKVMALLIGLVALWLYVDITGGAPSAVRAFVMVAFVQMSFVLKVPRNPLSALTASALVVLLVNPLDLFSASFQMSYGIVAALLVLGLPLADRWQAAGELFRDLPPVSWAWHHRWRDALWRSVIASLGIGLASSLVGAVTGVQFFNLFTPGALLANLWVIPASTLVILLGLVSLLSGLAGFTAGGVLANHAAVLVLWAVAHGVRGNLRLPGMWVAANFRAPWIGGAALTALLAVMLAGYAQGWRGWSRGFWPPFAVVALTLILGVSYG